MGVSGQSSRACVSASAAGLFAEAAPSWNLRPDQAVCVDVWRKHTAGHKRHDMQRPRQTTALEYEASTHLSLPHLKSSR